PGERRAHQVDLADEAELDAASPRIGAQRSFDVARDAADVTPLRLHVDVPGALELVPLDGDGTNRASELAIGAQANGLAARPEPDRDLGQRVDVGDGGAVVIGDDVVRLAVVGI